MLRTLVCTLFAFALLVGGLLAEEIKAKVKSYNADKGVLTVSVGEKEKEYKITDDTKIVSGKGTDVKNRQKALERLKDGANVVITLEKKDGKDVVTQLKMGGGKKKDK
jgi:hypothetical protein